MKQSKSDRMPIPSFGFLFSSFYSYARINRYGHIREVNQRLARPRLSLQEKAARRALRRLQKRNKATLALAQHFQERSRLRRYRPNVFNDLKPEQLITKDGGCFIESDDLNLKVFLKGLEKVGADMGFIEFLTSHCFAVSELEDCVQRFYKTRRRGQPIEREKIEAMFIFKSYFEFLTKLPHWMLIAEILNRMSRSKKYLAKDIISWFNKRNLMFKYRNGGEEVGQLREIYERLMSKS